MSKNINFRAKDKFGFETQIKPYPAIKQLPKWFTEASTTHGGGQYPNDGKLHFRGTVANYTFKKCTPLLDGMNMGYIIPLWADVMVEQDNQFPQIYWKTQANIFELHGPASREVPAPVGYDQVVYKYLNTWIPQTPKGY